ISRVNAQAHSGPAARRNLSARLVRAQPVRPYHSATVRPLELSMTGVVHDVGQSRHAAVSGAPATKVKRLFCISSANTTHNQRRRERSCFDSATKHEKRHE